MGVARESEWIFETHRVVELGSLGLAGVDAAMETAVGLRSVNRSVTSAQFIHYLLFAFLRDRVSR